MIKEQDFIPTNRCSRVVLHGYKIKGTSHDFIFQFSLFSTLADIFAV